MDTSEQSPAPLTDIPPWDDQKDKSQTSSEAPNQRNEMTESSDQTSTTRNTPSINGNHDQHSPLEPNSENPRSSHHRSSRTSSRRKRKSSERENRSKHHSHRDDDKYSSRDDDKYSSRDDDKNTRRYDDKYTRRDEDKYTRRDDDKYTRRDDDKYTRRDDDKYTRREHDKSSRVKSSRSHRRSSPDSQSDKRYGSSQRRSSSRNPKRHRHQSTTKETSDEKKHRKRSSSRNNSNPRTSNWDRPSQEPDEVALKVKPYQGGFSSAPPPPMEPNPNTPGQSSPQTAADVFDINQILPTPTLKIPTAADIEGDRKQRRLYIGNLPPGSSQEDVIGFFNGALLSVAAAADTPLVLELNESPVLKCEVFNASSRFCFLEFRTLPLTWYCLKLDGIAYNGYSLRVGRPHDYIPPSTGDPAVNAVIPGFENSTFRDSKPASAPPRGEGFDQKLYIQNLPLEFTDDQVRTVLEKFGALRVLNLIKDVSTGRNKGYGFFEYEDPSVSEIAIKALNGLQIENNTLNVQVASFEGPSSGEKRQGSMMVTSLPSSITQKFLSHALVSLQVEAARKVGSQPSKVVQLLNIVFQEDLLDDQEYADLVEDIKTEAEKYGPLKQIVIPRPSKDLSNLDGVGKVFLLFTDVMASRKARMMLNGRKFDQKRVTCASFYPEDRFLEGKYTLQST